MSLQSVSSPDQLIGKHQSCRGVIQNKWLSRLQRHHRRRCDCVRYKFDIEILRRKVGKGPMAMEINHWLLSSILPLAVLGQNHYQTISVPCAGDAGRWALGAWWGQVEGSIKFCCRTVENGAEKNSMIYKTRDKSQSEFLKIMTSYVWLGSKFITWDLNFRPGLHQVKSSFLQIPNGQVKVCQV